MKIRTILGAMLALIPLAAFAQDTQSTLTQSMGIDQKIGDKLPMDVPFKDESGKTVTMEDMFQGRPVLLVPMFYGCKTMCVALTDGIVDTLAKATKYDELRPGRDLDVVMLSIKPTETPELAMAKKNEIFNMLTPPKGNDLDVAWRADTEKGWHLLTGSYDNILKVTNAIGFKYKWDPQKDLINHPTCTVVVSKTGQITGYMIGPNVETKILQADLKLAQANKVAPKADQSFMFGCIMLDPSTGKYSFVVSKILNVACYFTVFVLAASIIGMSLKERRKARIKEDSASTGKTV